MSKRISSIPVNISVTRKEFFESMPFTADGDEIKYSYYFEGSAMILDYKSSQHAASVLSHNDIFVIVAMLVFGQLIHFKLIFKK